MSLILAAILAAAYAIALLLPGVRAERSLWPRRVNPNLVLIEGAGSSDGSTPSISPQQFRSWQGRRQKYFDGFAFYRVTEERVGSESSANGQSQVGALVLRQPQRIGKRSGRTRQVGCVQDSPQLQFRSQFRRDVWPYRQHGAVRRVNNLFCH